MAKSTNKLAGSDVNALIAQRAGALRREKKLSFDALAARSRLSKGMLVAIEKGAANPSIATLCKLAASLRVSLTELMAGDAPAASALTHVGPAEASELWRGPHGGRAMLLVGAKGPDMLELWEWTLFPREEFRSQGHPEGTVELLAVLEGTLAVSLDGNEQQLAATHRAVAHTDRPHAYRCHGRRRTRFLMVVREPSGGRERRTAGRA